MDVFGARFHGCIAMIYLYILYLLRLSTTLCVSRTPCQLSFVYSAVDSSVAYFLFWICMPSATSGLMYLVAYVLTGSVVVAWCLHDSGRILLFQHS